MKNKLKTIEKEIQALDKPVSTSEKLKKLGALLENDEISQLLFEAADNISAFQDSKNKVIDLENQITAWVNH